ncbi:MAG: protein-L-isoaspartate(D-aspartate) O-methyltransferase [Bacteroidales bacterium]|nr:protein-L-isoaspartate(D-aspartate) O-methyltransferase [Bacteroidales bacterium]
MTNPFLLTDSFRHKGLRKQLVEMLQKKGISDKNVLQAIEKIPRHYFFDSSFLEYAYEDKPFPIGAGQTISQPYTVAFQSMLLDVSKGTRVLEIGTGSGYQASVLAEMGAKVFTIERHKILYTKTSKLLPALGYHSIKTFFGDGYKGLPAYAPFDRILITAAAPSIPEELITQLKPGGIMVIPLGPDDIQTMTLLIKKANGGYQKSEHGAFRFVPMLKDKEK